MKKLLSFVMVTLLVAILSLGSVSVLNAEEGKADDGKVATTDDGKVDTTDGILTLKSANGDFAYKMDARLYLDAALYGEDEDVFDMHSGSEIRRMRFAIKATLWKNFIAEIDFDFAGNEVDIKDAYLGYRTDNFMFKVGNFRSPFSLEEVTTSRYISFIERGLPNAFPTGRLIGLAAYKWGRNWQIAGGIFGQEPGDTAEDALDDEEELEKSDEGYTLAGRFTIAPYLKGKNVIHVGTSFAYKTTNAFTEKMRFRGYDESKITKIRFLSTGKQKDVDHATMLGLETVFQFGPFHFQAEYITANVARIPNEGRMDYSLSGGYAFVSFFLTGESMPYYADQGEFGRIFPKSKKGAIELLARYSWINLNDLDADVEGGEGKNLTLGLSWYLNPNYKIMLNYTKVDHDKYADINGDYELYSKGGMGIPSDGFDYNVFQVRLLVAF